MFNHKTITDKVNELAHKYKFDSDVVLRVYFLGYEHERQQQIIEHGGSLKDLVNKDYKLYEKKMKQREERGLQEAELYCKFRNELKKTKAVYNPI